MNFCVTCNSAPILADTLQENTKPSNEGFLLLTFVRKSCCSILSKIGLIHILTNNYPLINIIPKTLVTFLHTLFKTCPIQPEAQYTY